mmetsp:Transcript_102417/g.285406  ORF Transcript_102417/g.285406 Transcript_102417/m.285406 type:complete len:265 (+) Transcript_102417:154-948(+)
MRDFTSVGVPPLPLCTRRLRELILRLRSHLRGGGAQQCRRREAGAQGRRGPRRPPPRRAPRPPNEPLVLTHEETDGNGHGAPTLPAVEDACDPCNIFRRLDLEDGMAQAPRWATVHPNGGHQIVHPKSSEQFPHGVHAAEPLWNSTQKQVSAPLALVVDVPPAELGGQGMDVPRLRRGRSLRRCLVHRLDLASSSSLNAAWPLDTALPADPHGGQNGGARLCEVQEGRVVLKGPGRKHGSLWATAPALSRNHRSCCHLGTAPHC